MKCKYKTEVYLRVEALITSGWYHRD